MQLPLTISGPAGLCMLLLVSNLLFWDHVAAKPTDLASIEDIYNRMVKHSHDAYYLAANVYQEFYINFFKRSWITSRVPGVCLTASIHTPQSREEVHKTKTEDLLKAMIHIAHAWEELLQHLLSALSTLPGASDKMLNSASAMKVKNHDLLEGLKSILRMSQPDVQENVYLDWSGLADLQSPDEDTYLLAVYSLCRCLKRDAHKIDTYLKVLRCRVIFKNECF